jgi:RNA polymerase sigma factor (sigma-70 family)
MSPRVSLRLLSAQSDKRLLDLVARGHERAFEALVLRYRRPLLGYCGRLGLSDARAEDVVQQALLRAWLALASGTEVRELRAWLYRIVHNTAVNALRAGAAEVDTPVVQHGRERLREVAVAPASDTEVERTLAARQALSDVAALPPMQRNAILLSAIEGRSHAEVADALGVTSTAARGLIYRARATLRGAAAALTPPWVVQWASGGATRMVPNAARLAQLYTGAGDSGSALLKGATLAATAAIAAGAAIGPLTHSQHHAGQGEAAAVDPDAGPTPPSLHVAAAAAAIATSQSGGSTHSGAVAGTGTRASSGSLPRATAYANPRPPGTRHRAYVSPTETSHTPTHGSTPSSTSTGGGGSSTAASVASSGQPAVSPPPTEKPAEKPAGERVEKPVEKPAEEKPVEEKPKVEEPGDDGPPPEHKAGEPVEQEPGDH